MGYGSKCQVSRWDAVRSVRQKGRGRVFRDQYYREFWRRSKRMKDVSALCYRGGADGSAGGPAVDPGFESEFPTVFAFLVLTTLPSGKVGKPGTLTVFPEDGVFKIRLSDRNRGADLWASGPTIRDAMIALEALFSEPFVPWRRAAYLGGGKAK